ncbi:uncharacterized protein LOC113312807 [Papaver somniferum]|uniref:uncharacterized protein LOC113312807 n=1 Tax=Papaver somniferum TaxID=3469 RepID=UPI000E6F5B09|nr:uncharacterized protein LOC113312807 [Papaver somniferum]
MENNNIVFQNDDIIKGRGERRPSRLQKQAPAVLQLDPSSVSSVGAANDNSNSKYKDSPYSSSGGNSTLSKCAIPLLSPLVLTPTQSPFPKKIPDDLQVAPGEGEGSNAEGQTRNRGNKEKKDTVDYSTTTPTSSSHIDWQHPATPAAFVEPSSLISFL